MHLQFYFSAGKLGYRHYCSYLVVIIVSLLLRIPYLFAAAAAAAAALLVQNLFLRFLFKLFFDKSFFHSALPF